MKGRGACCFLNPKRFSDDEKNPLFLPDGPRGVGDAWRQQRGSPRVRQCQCGRAARLSALPAALLCALPSLPAAALLCVLPTLSARALPCEPPAPAPLSPASSARSPSRRRPPSAALPPPLSPLSETAPTGANGEALRSASCRGMRPCAPAARRGRARTGRWCRTFHTRRRPRQWQWPWRLSCPPMRACRRSRRR